ncbi:MAG: DNA polymerase III subunit chi [Ectothiorhodospiraceae bacterium]|nr:DNA polymerase III subunit chi [Ectothiorhodospiraceae bacterium]
MTKVDFYILSTGTREQLACRLAEKAYTLGNRIYIHTETTEQSTLMDELLWSFREASFVPHEQYQAGSESESPIQIGCHNSPESHCEVLINLSSEVPLFFSRFLRVAELVGTEKEAKTQGRDRFRFYRDRGYPLETHELGSK